MLSTAKDTLFFFFFFFFFFFEVGIFQLQNHLCKIRSKQVNLLDMTGLDLPIVIYAITFW